MQPSLFQWGRKLSRALHQLGVNSWQNLSPQGQTIHSQWEANILLKGRALGRELTLEFAIE